MLELLIGLLPVLVAAPLAVSFALNMWDAYWQAPSVSPLPDAVQRALYVAQLLVVVLLCGPAAVNTLGLWSAAALYAALAVGSGYLLVTRGAVPCGCWGATERDRLSWRKVGVNALLAAVALLGVVFDVTTGAGLAVGVVQVVGVLALALLFAVGGREAVAAYRAMRPRVGFEMRWFKNFPDVGA
jgi:hypothetical protein